MPNFKPKTVNTVSKRPNAAKTSLGSKKVQKTSSEGQRLHATLNQLKPAIRIILRVLADGPLDSTTFKTRVEARTLSPIQEILAAMVSAGVLDVYTELRGTYPISCPVSIFKLV